MPESGHRIRNLTSNTIVVESYEIHERLNQTHQSNSIHRIAKNVTSAFLEPKDPNLQCKVRKSVSKQLDPWTLQHVEIAPARLPDEILCIFFSIEGHRYQSNILHNRCHSQYLMSSDGATYPTHKHITLYHPDHHHLTIAFRESYRSWMRPLRDDAPLSALSIPGTHNSPTYHNALPSVRCQSVSIREQLRRGVRFLDVRVQAQHHGLPLKDGLLLVHSVFPICLTGSRYFRPFVDEVLAFLQENPSETVIMSVKREGTGSSKDEHLSQILRQFYANDDVVWFTAPRVPYLGEVRGKIVLVRRFSLHESLRSEWGGSGWGIDASSWADNSPDSICPSGDLHIQDFYQVLETQNITEKIQYATEHLKRAAVGQALIDTTPVVPKTPFFINFLTASNFWKVGCWPDRIAEKINPAIVKYLCLEHHISAGEAIQEGSGSTGIVVCDWVGNRGNWDLVRSIIGMNAILETKNSPLL